MKIVLLAECSDCGCELERTGLVSLRRHGLDVRTLAPCASWACAIGSVVGLMLARFAGWAVAYQLRAILGDCRKLAVIA